MIKLQDILNEQEFKAKSKETGRVVVYKSKENMDKAIKGGKAEPLDKKTGDKPEKVKGADLFKKDTKKSDKPKSDKPVKLDDDAQQAIDDMDWNRYDDQGITNVNKVINDLDDNVDEWNQQIYNTIEELEGQIPQEDLDKLYSAEVDVMDLDDEALSEVPREELEKKTNALIDFHKKYSTIGKKTTAQEKDPNRDKKTGFKPGSSFGSNIGYRTGKNRMGGMYDGVIKLADLIKEGKVWERKFGEPLPTLNSVMKKHQQNQLNESPVSVLKPARVEKKSIVYGYITLQPYYNQIKKSWKELKTLLDKIDYVAIDFDDRNESLSAVTNLPGWKDPFIREPMIKSFRNFTKFVNNPKNMKDPKRVQNAIKKNIRQSALPKWIQLTKLYKQYLKFNNKKISSVFPETKGKKIGEKRIGDFGGFTLTEDVHKLFTNQSGFTQKNMRGAFEHMDWLMKNRYKKMIVQGPRN